FGLISTGVAGGRFGTTASHSRSPSSPALPPVRTVTGEVSVRRRSLWRARSAAPSTVSVTPTLGAVGSGCGDAEVAASTGTDTTCGGGGFGGAGGGGALDWPQAASTRSHRRMGPLVSHFDGAL